MTWYGDYLDWMLSGDMVPKVGMTCYLILTIPVVIYWIIFESPEWFRGWRRLAAERRKIYSLKKKLGDGEITEEEYDDQENLLYEQMDPEDSRKLQEEAFRRMIAEREYLADIEEYGTWKDSFFNWKAVSVAFFINLFGFIAAGSNSMYEDGFNDSIGAFMIKFLFGLFVWWIGVGLLARWIGQGPIEFLKEKKDDIIETAGKWIEIMEDATVETMSEEQYQAFERLCRSKADELNDPILNSIFEEE
tara:strand:+ start:66 stop:806 length:741 start_codon:yes stop_codon:yes gene_type:complete